MGMTGSEVKNIQKVRENCPCKNCHMGCYMQGIGGEKCATCIDPGKSATKCAGCAAAGK
jgi:hypothetical protein